MRLELIRKHVALPVCCDEMGMYIFDANKNMVMEVRGWGRLQKLGEECGERMQKAIGDAFAEAFNKVYGDDHA
jgi:hypothetical protein